MNLVLFSVFEIFHVDYGVFHFLHQIAQNLDDLYDYMIRRLMRANMEDNADLLDEVLSLLRSIKGAWDTLPKQLHANAG